ncbi:hypothetical protein ACFFOS_27665 [Nocardioides kongjuensis]|uniref:Uncharacterized protein n=1 Tax=Nocardioides kongjuensis TaxID=349522 RepID=A0A852RSW5_9ACTN|nr:hypothetical protein [Nocardioides kongjuensis]NYD33849.1 hypothetical protein [Nocardioides kongjuensis]
MSAEKLIEQADAYIASVNVDELHVDVQSLAATYEARKAEEDVRGQVAFARAIVRRARAAGYEPGVKALGDMTAAELKDELERRNEGRDEADLIVPTGKNKPDLLAALEADDAE